MCFFSSSAVKNVEYPDSRQTAQVNLCPKTFSIHQIPCPVIFCKKRSERVDYMKKIIFLGGDKRMLYAAKALGNKYSCTVYSSDNTDYDAKNSAAYDYAVLPLKKSTDGITIPDTDISYSALGRIVKEGGMVFTGSICPELERVCYGKGIALINYLEREELAIANAVPTAEGALEIAINRMPVTIFGCKALVTGYGRIAKILAKYLNAMGAHVLIACRRKSDMKWAEISGCTAVDITDKNAFNAALFEAEVIFNTVPHRVIEKDAVKENVLYIELASKDGIDPEAKAEIITARGLPGKTAPVTAGRIIAETIETILAERSDNSDT